MYFKNEKKTPIAEQYPKAYNNIVSYLKKCFCNRRSNKKYALKFYYIINRKRRKLMRDK